MRNHVRHVITISLLMSIVVCSLVKRYTKIEDRIEMGSVGPLRLFMFMVATAVIYGTRGTEKDRICTNHGYY